MIKNLDKGTRMTLGVEGKWSNHPADPGGKTMLGVTLKTFWRARHRRIISPDIQLRDLSPNQAVKIYKLMYWNVVCGDQLPSGIDVLVFDIQVNSGQGGRRLQMALNYLFGSRLVVDNSIGPKTIRVLNNLVDSDVENVYKIFSCCRVATAYPLVLA